MERVLRRYVGLKRETCMMFESSSQRFDRLGRAVASVGRRRRYQRDPSGCIGVSQTREYFAEVTKQQHRKGRLFPLEQSAQEPFGRFRVGLPIALPRFGFLLGVEARPRQA